MRGTRIFLALVALSVTVDARPDGYGVKGGRSYKAAADAVASAHATANADGGSLGIAKSSASAIANANSNGGGGGTSNAFATASAYGGSIDKTVASEKGNGYANEPGDSDDLRQSSDHSGDAEYKCINHAGGTDSWNSDAEHVASEDDYEDSKTTEESYDDSDCGPGRVKGHGGTPGSVGQRRCGDGQSSASHRSPTQDKSFGLSANSQHSTALGGGHEGKGSRPGTGEGSHIEKPCAPGDSFCLMHKPSVLNPYPTYDKNPDLSAGSSRPAPIDGGYGGNGKKLLVTGSSHATMPCSPGDSTCFLHNPDILNKPYLTSEKNPHVSTGSSSPVGIGGGITLKPEIASGTGNHPGVQCEPGDSKCSPHKPTDSNWYPAYDGNPHALVDAQHTIGSVSGHGEQNQRPRPFAGGQTVSQCAPGDWKCSSQKPTGGNPHPTHHENPFLSAGSQHSTTINSGHDEQNQLSGIASGTGNHPGVQCAPGDWKCSSQKLAGSSFYPAYDENPHALVDSQHTIGSVSGHGEQNQRPGIASGTGNHPGVQCALGDWKCSSQKPTDGNSQPTHHENPFLTVGSQHSTSINSGHDEQNQRPGIASGTGNHPGVQCAPGDWKCSLQKPTSGNPHPTHHENPFLSISSQHPAVTNSGHGEQNQRPEIAGGSGNDPAVQCAPGDWKCPSHKPSSNLHNGNPVSPVDSQHPTAGNSGHVDQNAKPVTIGGSHGESPCAHGDSICFPRQPSGSDSHPIYNGNPATWGSTSTYPTSFDTGYGGKPTGGHPPSTHDIANQFPSSGQKPGISNPFLNGQIDVSAIKKSTHSDALSGEKIYSSNPFLSPDNQMKPPSSSVHPIKPLESHGSPSSLAPPHFPGHLSGDSNQSQEHPKPPNPFFTHHVTTPSTSGEKHPGITSGSQTTVSNGSPNVGCYGSVSCSPNKPAQHFPTPSTYPHGAPTSDSGHSEKIPNLANPFFTQYGHRAHSSGAKFPESEIPEHHPQTEGHTTANNVPTKDCKGSVLCAANEPSDGPFENPLPTNHGSKVPSSGTSLSGHVATQSSHDSNTFPVDHQLMRPDSKSDAHGSIPSKPQSGPAPANQYPGPKAPHDVKKPEIIHGCGSGIPSVGCNGHNGPVDEDIHSSVTDGHGMDTTTSLHQYGVKGHRPVGIKGGYHQGHPVKLLESPGLAESDHFGTAQETSAQSTANASANANSKAYASSSSSSEGSRSSASAKSQAHNSNGGEGSTNSWASSSASASASAFASSYSNSHSHHGWTAPGFPQVPAE